MFKRSKPVESDDVFSAMPVRKVCVGRASREIAVHIHGRLGNGQIPLVCLHGYVRNMLDFSAFPDALALTPASGVPIVLIDLPGRGRSSKHPKNEPYTSLGDAESVLAVLAALDISAAVVLGQGHGGQVAMVMARRRPTLLAGAILVDSGPVTDPRGLVRTRNNLRFLESIRSEKPAREALRKMLSADYPGESPARLDQLAGRQFRFDSRGRMKGLFDARLIDQLDRFEFDDVLEPQWPLFDCLHHVPLLLVRTQLSDQLRRETFDEMIRRRSNAATVSIPGQGSPALLEGASEAEAIASLLLAANVPANPEHAAE